MKISAIGAVCLTNHTKNILKEKLLEANNKYFVHWINSQNIDDFKNLVLLDEELNKDKLYGLISQETEGHLDRIKASINAKPFYIYSDHSSLKIGNDNFFIQIPAYLSRKLNYQKPNHDIIECVIIEDGNFNKHMMISEGTILKGDCYIYDYKNADYYIGKPKVNLNGSYFVYCYEGLVAFVKYDTYKQVKTLNSMTTE